MIQSIFSNKLVIVILTARSGDLARTLSAALPGSEIHGKIGRIQNADKFFQNTVEHIRCLFEAGRPIIGICATGILIRAVGASLNDKRTEPPIIAISENGRSVVPLLGGHHGANKLATHLSNLIGAHPAITTAGDTVFGIALDDPPSGWKIANPEKAKFFMAELLIGEKINLEIEAGNPMWLTDSEAPFSPNGSISIKVTEKIVNPGEDALIFHPPVFALGIGCERNTDADEIIELIDKALDLNCFTKESIVCVASIDLKMDEEAIHLVASHLGVPARFFSAETLNLQTSRLVNPSEIVFKEVGCYGVSEGAALAASGINGELVIEKQKSRRATIALAKSDSNINLDFCGQSRGRLNIVGIGPGNSEWRTPSVTDAIMRSSDVIGYHLYLTLLGNLLDGKNCHPSELSEEIDRVEKALTLSSKGLEVVLVCSGDAGIYALATLVFESIHTKNRLDWNRVDVVVEPGISAIQAAAAKAGAPIGHDFCTISLSDLLTPWEQIECRINAAGKGDFVIGFYNPVSKQRYVQLEAAKKILLGYRTPETPVILARNIGRIGEKVTFVKLGDLTSEMADMLTIVIIGNSQSFFVEYGSCSRVYTPRGYANKSLANSL